MKIQAKAGANFAALDDSDAGEGLAIFFTQAPEDVVRWRLEVYASLDTGSEMLVGTIVVSPPSATLPMGELTRQVGAAVCPGAKSWSVIVFPADGWDAAGDETADITLASSKCCTAPVGLSRVSERYGYIADSAVAPQTLTLAAGRIVTHISAVGQAGGGTIAINGGTTITVPQNIQIELWPQAGIPQLTSVIAFNKVSWLVEFLESA